MLKPQHTQQWLCATLSPLILYDQLACGEGDEAFGGLFQTDAM